MRLPLSEPIPDSVRANSELPPRNNSTTVLRSLLRFGKASQGNLVTSVVALESLLGTQEPNARASNHVTDNHGTNHI